MNPANLFTVDVRILPAKGVRSLVWHNGKLMDWVSGNVEYDLNGIKRGPTVFYTYRFDAAVVSPSGDFLEGEPGERLRPGMIGVYDLDEQKLVWLKENADLGNA